MGDIPRPDITFVIVKSTNKAGQDWYTGNVLIDGDHETSISNWSENWVRNIIKEIYPIAMEYKI